MKIGIGLLSQDPSNVRKHSKRNLEVIAASLKKFGQQKPIVVDKDNVVIAGNGTLEAAKLLGWNEIEVVRSGLVGAERTAYAIADNRSAELAEWDDESLSSILKSLENDKSIDILLTGFNYDEIKELYFNTSPHFDPVKKEDQNDLSEPSSLTTCPNCGHEF